MRDFSTNMKQNLNKLKKKLIIAPVRSPSLFWPLFFSFVSSGTQEKELKDSQADLMMLNTNKSLHPDAPVKNATTASRTYGELRRVSHNNLSKSNSSFLSPSYQRPRWEIQHGSWEPALLKHTSILVGADQPKSRDPL